MNFPIVKVSTSDGYTLHGLLSEPRRASHTIIIHMHGSAGDFYQSTFFPHFFELAFDMGVAFLSTNSRGTGVYDVEDGTMPRGAAVELFEECLLDIDAWVEFAALKGYTNIILSGHSFGTNKIQYYVNYGSHGASIRALILLGFTDSYGGQLDYLSRVGKKNGYVLREAHTLMHAHTPLKLLSDPVINWGELPQSARSYINFMTPGSALSRILPLWKKEELTEFKRIRIPMIGIVGDTGECTVIPPEEAVRYIASQNPHVQSYMIRDCGHSYKGKEDVLISLLQPFLERITR